MPTTITLTFAGVLTRAQRLALSEACAALDPAPIKTAISRERPPGRPREPYMHLLCALHAADNGEGVLVRDLPFAALKPPQATPSAIYASLAKGVERGHTLNDSGYYSVTEEGLEMLRRPDNIIRLDAAFREAIE